ncbi:uncharacterized protein N7477_007160 [Penicillium maclennaniae]|uniref:uncharacterized protein n=1 Tax=Penicillium maclennaniae TaxID=1343394 RepID=UPI0025417988|nr:uncharacterized protein N7477_007160 [Penicillium maclennaniae]KAJ5668590.1 hypothetical protein N7477_007160 [Penicillium maclennaniae]
MESVRQSCRPRHQLLTLKCYPKYQKGVPEVKPNPSELSYLLYYASTRRSKLTKVGAFLEKRVAKDVWRRRLGNVQVALHILTALIEKLPRDLPIYASSVLTVLETVLKSHDVSLVEDSIATFETFCYHQDIATIAADQGLAQKYQAVVRTYAGFADPSSPSYSSATLSPAVAIRWRNAGLRAIKGVVSSESLAADGGTSLRIILPVILENLYSSNENLLVPLKARLEETKQADKTERDENRNRRMSVNTVNTIETANGDPALAAQSTADVDRQAELDARLLALRCLEQIIVSGSNRGQIRVAATVILQFIASKQFPRTVTRDETSAIDQAGNWATSLIELIATWCPVQIRFVILVMALETLQETLPKEDALDSAFTILSVVNWLLKSSVNMIGLSVMDILFGLMLYVSRILSPHDNAEAREKHEQTPDSAIFLSARRKGLLALVEQCIGNLATHIYYGDQVADMMRAILRRFKPTPTQENAMQSSLATVHETSTPPVVHTDSNSESNGEKAHGDTFSHTAAKQTALRAIKAILIVANLRAPTVAAASESRNPVGIHVWEGTQGLLRDPDHEVRHAYAEAFLTWLRLETNKRDLKVRVDTPRYIKQTSKRDSESDKPNRRSTSAPRNQREIVALAAQSSFLRLLHLAIYDSALEEATVESEVLVLHLLLASLVENLGLNAVQFGLPMVLKLQEDLFTSVDLGTSRARINIGSLVHGYLLAICEKFNLESTRAGIEIRNEIGKRQSQGQWLSRVKVPPTGLNDIATDDEKTSNGDSDSSIALTPFQDLDGLIDGMDKSYRETISSPPQSPSSLPARGFNFPVLNHAQAVQSQVENVLPPSVREEIFSAWSRESCMAAVEKESIKALSINGSRVGTMTRNSQFNGATNGSPAGSASQKYRLSKVPDTSCEDMRTPDHSPHRGSPVRVTQLRRVLSVKDEPTPRNPSPLHGVDRSNISVISSGSESMVSGAFSASEMEGDDASVHYYGQGTPDQEGQATPRASASAFPNDSQRSLLVDRPSTAPDNSQQANGKADYLQSRNKSLNRNLSRSNASLSAGILDDSRGAPSNGNDHAFDNNHRDQLRKLLDGFLSPKIASWPTRTAHPADWSLLRPKIIPANAQSVVAASDDLHTNLQFPCILYSQS